MRKFLLVPIALLTVTGVATAVAAPKVTICHATSSATNPWVRTVVSANATAGHFDNNGTPESGHEKDVLLQGEVECPVPSNPTPPTPTPTPTPVTPPVTPTTPTAQPNFTGFQGK